MKLIHYPTYVQCPICKKPFKTDLYLRRHIMSSHEGANRNYPKSNGAADRNIVIHNIKGTSFSSSGSVDIKYELQSAS